jgi:hypothetical protein
MATSPEKPGPWTKEQYAEWLKDIAHRLEILVEEQRPWPKAKLPEFARKARAATALRMSATRPVRRPTPQSRP